MLAQSFTKPQTQRLAILNAQFDLGEIAIRTETGNRPGQKIYATLFPRAGVNEDLSIYEGDILYGPIDTGRKRRRTIEGNTNGQQPYVLSSLNGMYMDTTEYNALGGHGERAKRRNAFKKRFEVIGISLKNNAYETYKKENLDNPVAIIGGVFHMPNLGSKPIKPMDIVLWDVPEGDGPMIQDTTNYMPHTPTMRKLVTEPMDLTKSVKAEDLVEVCFKMDNEKSDERNIINKLVDLVALLTDESPKKVQSLFQEKAKRTDTKGKLQKVLHELLESVAAPMTEQKSRIIGRCLRGAQPGERMDILVLR